MNEHTEDLLTGDALEEIELPRRRSLLPWWIKVFTWLFLLSGVVTPLAFIVGAIGYNAQFALYGLETDTALSPIGFLVAGVFMLKGLVAYGLWMEKEWAVQAGIVDAVIGICICCFEMFISPFLNERGFIFNIRLELILLIPYILWLRRNYDPWKEATEKS